ncbi:MAG TPA: pyroglutamyl-peptidase I [Aquabacterium sp.]|nr:pyroglutamyl-peptidase I [Aquabacterium sp.]HQC97926.1 pyroglutamyl-peptidase I [Aquabacterium sp.]
MQRLLITGFEPFGGETVNPSWEVARALHGRRFGAAQVVAEQLPCVFARSLPALRAALRRHRPQWVVCLGLAGSRSAISLERVGVNLCDARIADNAGVQPAGSPVVAGGPAAYFTRLPVKALVQRLQADGLPAELSLSAGSFVCNQVMYGLLHALRRRPQVPAGFIHLPPLPQQAAAHPGSRPLALDAQVRGLALVLDALAAGLPELQQADGRTD